jgi:hypothetical protein
MQAVTPVPSLAGLGSLSQLATQHLRAGLMNGVASRLANEWRRFATR